MLPVLQESAIFKFRHQPRTVLSWLQSVTLISANWHVGPLSRVQVVYIVIELSRPRRVFILYGNLSIISVF